jgi:predicted transcriptional regulator
MRTAVSIPDQLFAQAEALAHRLGKSRSQIYREALAEYLLRRDQHVVTAALDDVVRQIGGSPDRWVVEAGRSALERSDQ